MCFLPNQVDFPFSLISHENEYMTGFIRQTEATIIETSVLCQIKKLSYYNHIIILFSFLYFVRDNREIPKGKWCTVASPSTHLHLITMLLSWKDANLVSMPNAHVTCRALTTRPKPGGTITKRSFICQIEKTNSLASINKAFYQCI